MQFAWKFGLIMLVALALVVLPGGGNALDVVLTLLTVVFFASIAFLVYRLWRQYRFELDALDSNVRLVLYASPALALLTLTATSRCSTPAAAVCSSGSRCSRWRRTGSSGSGRATGATSRRSAGAPSWAPREARSARARHRPGHRIRAPVTNL